MKQAINIYCDESCHLENDKQPVMVLGAVWCPEDVARESAVRIREIKMKHNLPASFEIKWTKVGRRKADFYQEVMDYFFDDDDLHFRAVIIPKADLSHEEFDQDHDTWYYKMYFLLLQVLLGPTFSYDIYLDIKDTRSQEKVTKLREALCNNLYDFNRAIIRRIQQVRSHEVEQVQLADLLIGTVSYANRGLTSNKGKVAMVERMRERSRYTLDKTTLLGEKKVNLLKWRPRRPRP